MHQSKKKPINIRRGEGAQSQAREYQRSVGHQDPRTRAQETQPIGSDKQAEKPGSCAAMAIMIHSQGIAAPSFYQATM